MELFCVVQDTAGAHEQESVYSIWNTKQNAEKEAKRLQDDMYDESDHLLDRGIGYYTFYTVKVELNKSSDQCIC